MSAIAEFTDTEIATIREMLVQRYRKEVEIHLADSDLLLDARELVEDSAEDSEPSAVSCPTVYWHERNANFVIFKCGDSRYRTQFFYTPHEQFGTGITEYQRLDECIAAALQTQSDHERTRQGNDKASEEVTAEAKKEVLEEVTKIDLLKMREID